MDREGLPESAELYVKSQLCFVALDAAHRVHRTVWEADGSNVDIQTRFAKLDDLTKKVGVGQRWKLAEQVNDWRSGLQGERGFQVWLTYCR